MDWICKECGVEIDEKTSVVLHPCEHRVCHPCLTERQAERGIKKLKCVCKQAVEKITLFRPSKKWQADGEEKKYEEKTVVDKYAYNEVYDTFRALMKQVFDMDNDEKHEMIGNGIIVGCIYKIKLENNTPMPSLMAKFTMASDGDKHPSRESVKGLIQLFRMLHSSLLPLSFSGLMEDTEDDETLVVRPGSIIELVEHAAIDKQLLHLCLFALANGHDDVPGSSELRGKPSHQAAVLAPYISFDLFC